jgi:hypothetical protein
MALSSGCTEYTSALAVGIVTQRWVYHANEQMNGS